MTAQEMATLAAGPAAAVVVCLLVLGAVYRLVTDTLVPLATRALDRHLSQVDTMLEQQRKESAALARALAGFERALQNIDIRLERLEDKTQDA